MKIFIQSFFFFLKNNVPEDSPKGCSMDVAAGRDTRTPPSFTRLSPAEAKCKESLVGQSVAIHNWRSVSY